MEETKFKATLPKSALNMYIQLYCRKRKLSETNGLTAQMEATKSWLSLNKCEKEVFITAYNNTIIEYRKKIADSLKNATPYLKKRDPKRSKKITRANSNCRQYQEDHEETNFDLNHFQNVVDVSSAIINEINVDDKSDFSHVETQQIPLCQNEIQSNNQSNVADQLAEPIAPRINIKLFCKDSKVTHFKMDDTGTVKWKVRDDVKKYVYGSNAELVVTLPSKLRIHIFVVESCIIKNEYLLKSGKELFEMLRSEEENSLSWESLSIPEKRRFQNAVLSIKKNYIRCYKSYLESLSPEKLFSYYLKTKNVDHN